ncbi:hypothetical protein FV141_04115 [Dermacoccus abyssi]|uniref:Uncharacterized protein n=1 Tax=Dermacoccus abyssi TaxID=322596 RepID=A0ABX5Z767_9MICO|nr:hypothetical protein FV141_04115 [Dermacoccus abyssi]
MFDAATTSALGERLGVAWRWAPSKEAGFVTNNVAHVMVERRRADSPETAHAMIREALDETVPGALELATFDKGLLSVDVAARPEWCTRLQIDFGPLSAAATTWQSVQPDVHIDGASMTFAAAAERIGLDVLTWALLDAAHPKRIPVPLAAPESVLASRRDANTLALVRRAHSVASLAVGAGEEAGTAAGTSADGAGRRLLAALALVPQAAEDAVRTGRTRPLLTQIVILAERTTQFAEHSPATRTDLPVFDAARRVLEGALTEARLAAPVPY